MHDKESPKVVNNSDLFRPHLKRAKNILLGETRPHWFVQLTFYFAFLLSTIFLLWNAISLFILLFPDYLRIHKGVDVQAIIELRGRTLGFQEDVFHHNLLLFFSIASGSWLLALIALPFIWRQQLIAVYVRGFLLVTYVVTMFVLLGSSYFLEDTTNFDKYSLLTLTVLLLILYFQLKKRKSITQPFVETDH
jgi:hypothetical protein